MTIGIYQIINKKTGQIYVGKSINIEKRFQEHINGTNCPSSYIDNAIQKYGKDCFNFKIIEEFDKNTPYLNDVLNNKEQYYIARYNTFKDNFHYNLTIGGDGTYGFTHSEKSKKKMSESKKGKYTGENNPMYGKHHSEKTKKKISENHADVSGKNNPMYGKTGENHPFYGKHHSKETKKKMSEANSGENNPFYGKKHTEETKKKISKAISGENHPNYGQKLSKETKKKISEAHIGKKHSKETKKKMSESKKGKYTGENHPMWRNYARIIKKGKNSNNKQVYSIIYQGKRIKQSISIDKLKKWFAENYPNEQLILEFKK